MLQILLGFPDYVVAVLASGEVTGEEFRGVLVPAANAKFERHEELDLYYQFGPDFTGMSAGAMWEDTKLDISHWKGWRRIAIVTDVGWVRHGANGLAVLLHLPCASSPTQKPKRRASGSRGAHNSSIEARRTRSTGAFSWLITSNEKADEPPRTRRGVVDRRVPYVTEF